MKSDDKNIGVMVRVRPLLAREKSHSASLIEMPDTEFDKGKVILKSNDKPDKEFIFDEAIWSFDESDKHYMDNTSFYKKSGPELIDHFFQGYNVCLLAYGQTGSGKTFTMMGDEQGDGFIPMLVEDILNYKTRLVSDKINCELKFSYMEVYNENVRDLLYEGKDKKWKVREHPETGPYVEGLREFDIESFKDFKKYLNLGNKNRSTASTMMNDKSSRSHAIINLYLKQTKFHKNDNDLEIGKIDSEIISNIKLVDLAGSERLSRTQIYGQHDRMKEGSLINKSLTVLGRCINILSKNTTSNSNEMIPYRDSILTYILKENLGGNSKTVMIFCVAPLDYEESLQTLNYATRVKHIKTKAKQNQIKLSNIKMDWDEVHKNDSVVESLKEEIELLNEKLTNYEVSNETDKLSKMISFLEKQLTESKFQNKYLSSKIKEMEFQKQELQDHNRYLNSLLRDNLDREVDLKLQHQNQLVENQLDILQKQIILNQQDLEVFLNDFTPTSVYT